MTKLRVIYLINLDRQTQRSPDLKMYDFMFQQLKNLFGVYTIVDKYSKNHIVVDNSDKCEKDSSKEEHDTTSRF